MMTGPTDGKCGTPAGGPGGMPLALRLNEGLGFTGVLQKFVQGVCRLLFGLTCALIVHVFGVAQIAMLFLRHGRRCWFYWFAAIICSVAVTTPVLAKDDAVARIKERGEVRNRQGERAVPAGSPRMDNLQPSVQVQPVYLSDGFVDGSPKVLGGSSPTGVDLDSSSNEVSGENREHRYGEWYWYLQAPLTLCWLLGVAGCLRGRGNGHDGEL